MKKIKPAVVGIGSIGIRHVAALHGMGVELAWLIDIDHWHAKTVAAEYGVTNYSIDITDVLNSDVGCIHLCTPPNLHYDQITIESEDAVILHMLFEDGVIGSCVLSEISTGRINRLEIEITGSRKNIWWNSEDNNVINIGTKNAGINTFVYPFGNGFGETLGFLFENFYRDIKPGYADEKSQYPTLYEGMRNVLICNAAYTSANNQGKWVEINV